MNYLLRIKCVSTGQLKYMMQVPAFKSKMEKLTISGQPVDEKVLLEVLLCICDEVENGVIGRKDVPMPTIRNMIRKLNNEIEGSNFEPRIASGSI